MTVMSIEPMILLYTREYTGDGHVIKAKESYTWTGTDTTRVIESIQFDGGYFDSGSGANYYVRDYLGNIIAVVDQGGHLVQATDYYPYGLPFRMPDIDEDNNRYLFGGKEFLTEDGLNEYYQEARQYIPRIPRFDRMDDRCEDNREHTSYLAFAGNPIMCVDPDGKAFILSPQNLDNIDAVLNILNTGFKGKAQFSANEVSDGKYMLAVNCSQIPVEGSDAEKRRILSFNMLCNAVNDPILLEIKLVECHPNVAVGKAFTSEVDIEDIKKLDSDGVGGQLSALGHELIEQYYLHTEGQKEGEMGKNKTKSISQNDINSAHKKALKWEGLLNNVTIIPMEPSGYENKPVNGDWVIRYVTDEEERKSKTYRLENGNIE